MKEATGELSMTVIVIVAAVALVAILGILFVNPNSLGRRWIQNRWNDMTGDTTTELTQPQF